jgi:hypothetical protein
MVSLWESFRLTLLRHFSNFIESDDILPKMDRAVFLAIDDLSYRSIMNSSEHIEFNSGKEGYGRGYVIAVDADYDNWYYDDATDEINARDYLGEVKVLDQLIMTDFYALLLSGCQFIDEFWWLARLHPREVYVGPVTEAEREKWKEIRESSSKPIWKFW